MTSIKQYRDNAYCRLAIVLTAHALDVPARDIAAPTRGDRDVAYARQVAMYLAHVAFGMSLARVATGFDRDRSTVAHACHIIEDKRDDSDFDAWIDALEAACVLVPPPISGAGPYSVGAGA